MTEDLRVEVDRQSSTGWAFPAYELATDNILSIETDKGRSSERDQFEPGTADIELQVDRQDTTFVRNYNEEPEYINGFTRLNLDYLSEAENNIHIFSEADGMTLREQPGVGMAEFDIQFGTQGWEWQFGSDREYWAKVDPYREYVVSMHVQDFLGDDDNFDFYLVVYWFTETGGFISDEWFNKINTPVDVETRVHARAIAPMKAGYCSIGIHSNGSALADFNIRFSKFMIHEYDEAYDIANGTPVKPYANQDLYDRAPEASTPIRVVIPGNQYNIANYPTTTIGAGPYDREMSTINLAPGIYDMESMADSTAVSNHFVANRVTKTLITTDAHNGVQCMRAQTTVAGSGSWVLWFSSNSVAYNIPVKPGQQYEFSFWMKNKSVSSATFSFSVKHQDATSTTLLASQVIAGSSAWIKYSGTWTCPADNYAVLLWVQFNTSNYDLYIDQIEAYQTSGVEPDMTNNYFSHWGDLEQVTSLFMRNQLSRNAGMVLQDRLDSGANSPAGPRVIRATKPAASTAGDFYWGTNAITSAAWSEAGRVYSFKFWARKISGTAPELLLYARPNSALYTDSFTFVNKVVFSNTDWAEYSFTYTAPAGCSGTNFAMVVSGVTAEEVSVEIDDIRFVRFQEEQVSNSITDLERTTVYRFEASDNRRDIYLSYANDLVDDPSIMYKYYHSGKTRTRYSATITSIGQNVPGGTTASLVWVGTSGRVAEQNAVQGVVAYDAASSITLPTSGSVTITGLAPDIPWRAWAPMIRLEILSNGGYTVGYTFADEYIGPDGYEATPEITENARFAGVVQRRLDDVDTIAEDDRRLYTVKLECMDKLGMLSRASLQSPYQSVVLRDEPLVYVPLNSENLTEIAGRIQSSPEIYTRGTPSSWGAEYDSQTNLVGTNEGSSWKFTPSGSDFSGQVIQLTDGAINHAIASEEIQTLGIWFSHTATISGANIEVLFSQLDERDTLNHGAYAALTANGLDVGVDSYVSYVGRPELALDGQPHYVVLAYDGDEARIYLDGELIGIDSVVFSRFTTTFVGGEYFEGRYARMFNGNIGHFEIYDYKLSAEQVYDHWIAGMNLRKGETEVERIEYVLDLANQPGIPPIVRDRDGNIPVAKSTMTSPDWNSDTAPTEILTEISKSTGGQVFAANDGAIIYENRSQRYNNGGSTNQSWHIGVGQDIEPELSTGLQVGPDMNKLINEAIITVKNLDVDEGGIQRASNERSIKQYGRFTYKETFDVNTPDEAKYAAQWLVGTNNKPYPRYSQLVFNGHANDATAEFCRRVRISDYMYGTIALENGLDEGVISGFVENIKEVIEQDGAVMKWTTYIQLSPAQNQRVWKLEDPDYGAIDSGNRIAY